MKTFSPHVTIAPTENYSSREGSPVTGTVIHFTAGGSASSSVSWLRKPEAAGSAHFVVSRAGQVFQLVSLEEAAWHVGQGEMNRGDGEVLSDPNQFTIGIELANWGPLVSDGSAFWGQIGSTMFPYEGLTPKKAKLTYPDIGKVISCYWEPYPELQIEALLWLLSELRKEGYEDAVNNLAGHEEVAMPLGRKMDPGPLFPWERLGRTSERTEGELV